MTRKKYEKNATNYWMQENDNKIFTKIYNSAESLKILLNSEISFEMTKILW